MRHFVLFIFTLMQLYAFSYTITPEEIDENLKEKFPIEKKILFSKFIFSNPKLSISKTSNLVDFECNVLNSSISLDDGTVPVFRVYASSDIKYNGKDIYLKKIDIRKIENEKLSAVLEDKLKIGAELLLNMYFSKKPIYKLSEGSNSLKVINSVIDDVLIKDGNIEVYMLQ